MTGNFKVVNRRLVDKSSVNSPELTWYCMDRVSSCNIYAVQQDTQSDF